MRLHETLQSENFQGKITELRKGRKKLAKAIGSLTAYLHNITLSAFH